MSELVYSSEAESILNLFHSVDLMVYVEGQDDIPFWEFMFDKFTNYKVEIQEVGSCNALKPYMDKIAKSEIQSVVACDSDMTPFLNGVHTHNNIIRTPKYSIENTLINIDSLSKAIKVIARTSSKNIDREKIESWCEDLYEKIKSIVILDIYNAKNQCGLQLNFDNASRFMKSKKSSDICQEKVKEHISMVTNSIENYDESLVFDEVVNSGYQLEDFTRGHFLFSAAVKFCSNYVKSFGNKSSVSNDELYSALILSLATTFNESHDEFIKYQKLFGKIEVAA